MNTMHMPGFTAETSLQQTQLAYWIYSSDGNNPDRQGRVEAALRGLNATCTGDDGSSCTCPGKPCVAGPNGCACIPPTTGGPTTGGGTTAVFFSL